MPRTTRGRRGSGCSRRRGPRAFHREDPSRLIGCGTHPMLARSASAPAEAPTFRSPLQRASDRGERPASVGGSSIHGQRGDPRHPRTKSGITRMAEQLARKSLNAALSAARRSGVLGSASGAARHGSPAARRAHRERSPRSRPRGLLREPPYRSPQESWGSRSRLGNTPFAETSGGGAIETLTDELWKRFYERL